MSGTRHSGVSDSGLHHSLSFGIPCSGWVVSRSTSQNNLAVSDLYLLRGKPVALLVPFEHVVHADSHRLQEGSGKVAAVSGSGVDDLRSQPSILHLHRNLDGAVEEALGNQGHLLEPDARVHEQAVVLDSEVHSPGELPHLGSIAPGDGRVQIIRRERDLPRLASGLPSREASPAPLQPLVFSRPHLLHGDRRRRGIRVLHHLPVEKKEGAGGKDKAERQYDQASA